MGKPLVNTKDWTRNDIRMMILVQLVLVYPVLAGALFMVLLFFVLPRPSIWPHAFWLIASGAWVLLLTIILPLMRDKHDYYEPTGAAVPAHTQPDQTPKDNGSTEKIPQVHVRVEAAKMDRINRDSVLTNRSSYKSEDRSSDGLEKGTLEDMADKENPEKLQGSVYNSRENIQKSMDSISSNATLNKQETQSGEFMNDCIETFEDDNTNQYNDDVLEDDNKNQDKDDVLGDDNKMQVNADVHHENNARNDKERDSNEKESNDDDSDIETINETQDMNGKIEEGKKYKGESDVISDNKDMDVKIEEGKTDKGGPDVINDSKSNTEDLHNTDSKTDNIESQIHTTEVVSPVPLNVVDKQLCQDDTTDDDEEEEFGELVEVPSLAGRRNIAHPVVDTALANESYTVSAVSTPISAASLDRRNSNVVHLFIQGN